MWVTICFNTKKNFIEPSYLVEYEGLQVEVKRGEADEGHNLFIQTTQIYDHDRIIEIGFRFLSELAWLFDDSIEVLAYGGSSHKTPMNVANVKFNRIMNSIGLEDYEQIAFTIVQKLVLGLYREGNSSNSKFYAFLSYYKIINMKYNKGPKQKEWINSNIHKIKLYKDILDELKSEGINDFGEYLYNSLRCAIAHANLQSKNGIADPDNIDDIHMVSKGLSLINELASILIREEFDVPTKSKAFNTTLIKRFRELFGDDFVTAVVREKIVDATCFPEIPKMSFRIYKSEKHFDIFKNLDFRIYSAEQGQVILSNHHQDWPLHTKFLVDFIKEIIYFDLSNVCIDDKHQKFHVALLLDYYYFFKLYILNGRLEIWDEDHCKLLARLPPYIPTNIDFRGTISNVNKTIKYLEERVLTRTQ